MIDLATLRLIWWVLLGILFMGFAIMDGFDLGVAALFPWVSHDDTERRVTLNTFAPVWEGNQVWIILGAGALFAAWPMVYAVAFSGAYFAVLLLLLTMGIARPVSIKYRSKLSSQSWRRFWDWIIFIGGFVPSLIFGILVGNVLLGLPFYFDSDLRISYSGTLLDLFHPFALWCGLTSLFMLMMHGGLYLSIKTEAPIQHRAIFASRISALLFILFFAGGGFWIAYKIMGYQLISAVDPNGYSNPLNKEVGAAVGAWLNNYAIYPILQLVPALGFLGATIAFLTARIGSGKIAFIGSSLSIIGVIGTVGVSMFPFILPSSTHLTSSLLVWDASSSYVTLFVMLGATMIFFPIILLYTAWVYRIMRGKVTRNAVENHDHYIGH